MKKYNSEGLVPYNFHVEGKFSNSRTKMLLNLLALFTTDPCYPPTACKLPKAQQELFTAFHKEQKRINRNIEVRFLKKYLAEQRKTANQMASYLKQRDKKEIANYGEIDFWAIGVGNKEKRPNSLTGAPIGNYKITNNLFDLRNKVSKLDSLLNELRGYVYNYEHLDDKRLDNKRNPSVLNFLSEPLKKRRKIS